MSLSPNLAADGLNPLSRDTPAPSLRLSEHSTSSPSPISSTATNTNAIPSSSRPTRSFSQSSLPYPGAGLRAALLGYLGEVEASIRSRLGGERGDSYASGSGDIAGEAHRSDSSSASDGRSASGEWETETDGEGSTSGWGVIGDDVGVRAITGNPSASGWGSHPSRERGNTAAYGGELRNRKPFLNGRGEIPDVSNFVTNTENHAESSSLTSRTQSHSTPPSRSFSSTSQDALLSHLSWLREDILASLPPAVLSAPASSREWLRGLPQRLMAVERGLWADSASPDQSSSFGIRGLGSTGAVESARKKVLEMARGILPADEWEGWERLGWEETDLFPPTRPGLLSSRSRSRGNVTEDDEVEGEGPDGTAEEEEEEESKFLFPNRTPAAAQAIASRRRTIRSKSLGAAGQPGKWADILRAETTGEDRQGILGGVAAMPKLQRMRTLPNLLPPDRSMLMDESDNERGGDELDAPGGEEEKDLVGLPTDYISGKLQSGKDDFDPLGLGQGKGKVAAGIRTAEALGPSVTDALEKSDDGKKLIRYEDLPVEWRNNEHIITGYRFIPLHAATGPIPLIKSAFSWHNETVNIQSHFIPTIFILLVIPFMIHSTPLPEAHPLDTAVLVLYLIAAISCLFSSAEWHVLSGCASKKWMEWGACVDCAEIQNSDLIADLADVGISWLIAASFGTVVYNAFYCQPKAVVLYCATNAACGALGSYLPFQRWFNLRRMKPWRIAFFLLLNVAMFAPMLQLFWKYGWVKGQAFVSPFGPSVLAYLIGLLFYAFHFPECIWPGKFDTVLHSHQVWHAGIVVAIILHYKAVFQVHDLRYDYSCAAEGAGLPVSAVVGNWLSGIIGASGSAGGVVV